jgi:hypothetical protein
MPFTVEAFATLRPYLYHLTARPNLPYLRAEHRLDSAATLLHAAGRADLIRTRRDRMLDLAIGERIIVLRDQIPLRAANAALEGNWKFDDFLADINRRIYFWPGDTERPIPAGRGHFAQYAAPGQPHRSAILRVPLRSLLAANPDQLPAFSRYNYGSPRRNNGQPIPRGPETFRPADQFPGSPGEVVEVTFLGTLALPTDSEVLLLNPDTLVNNRLVGRWSSLFTPAP